MYLKYSKKRIYNLGYKLIKVYYRFLKLWYKYRNFIPDRSHYSKLNICRDLLYAFFGVYFGELFMLGGYHFKIKLFFKDKSWYYRKLDFYVSRINIFLIKVSCLLYRYRNNVSIYALIFDGMFSGEYSSSIFNFLSQYLDYKNNLYYNICSEWFGINIIALYNEAYIGPGPREIWLVIRMDMLIRKYKSQDFDVIFLNIKKDKMLYIFFLLSAHFTEASIYFYRTSFRSYDFFDVRNVFHIKFLFNLMKIYKTKINVFYYEKVFLFCYNQYIKSYYYMI